MSENTKKKTLNELKTDLNELKAYKDKNEQIIEILGSKEEEIMGKIQEKAIEAKEKITETISEVYNEYTSKSNSIYQVLYDFLKEEKYDTAKWSNVYSEIIISAHFPKYKDMNFAIFDIENSIKNIKKSIKHYNEVIQAIDKKESIYIDTYDNLDKYTIELKENIKSQLDVIKECINKLADILSSIKEETYQEYVKPYALKLQENLSTFISNTKDNHKKMSDALDKFTENIDATDIIYTQIKKTTSMLKEQNITPDKNKLIIEIESIAKKNLETINAKISKINEELANQDLQGKNISFIEYLGEIIKNIKSGSNSQFLDLFKNNPFMSICFILIIAVIFISISVSLYSLFQYAHRQFRYKYKYLYENVEEKKVQRLNSPYKQKDTSNTSNPTRTNPIIDRY